MPIAAIGGLKIRSVLWAPAFYLYAGRSLTQARAADGCLEAQTFGRDGLMFSLTLWTEPRAILAYSTSGAHRKAMKAANRISFPLYFHRFDCDVLPSHDDAYARWLAADPEKAV